MSTNVPSTRENILQNLIINGDRVAVDVAQDTPILWVIRDALSMTGTKFGCGMGLCGACTLHLDGVPIRSCITPIQAAYGKEIRTIEAINSTHVGQAVQSAWLKCDVPQCGYCQSGQIMSAAALLATNRNPEDSEINSAMSGNICRCGTYAQIREAIRDASRALIQEHGRG